MSQQPSMVAMLPPQKHSSNHPLPAAYVDHLEKLVRQSLAAASLPPEPWTTEIVEAVRAVPLRRWVDHLARSRREQEEEQAWACVEPVADEYGDAPSRPATTSSGSPARPSFLSSRLSSYASSSTAGLPGIGSGSSTSLAPPSTAEHAAPHPPVARPSSPSAGAQSGAELAAFLARVPNFQRYPPPFDLSASPTSAADSSADLFSASRRRPAPYVHRAPTDGRVPGAFPDHSSSARHNGSLGAIDLLADDDDADAEAKAEKVLAAADARACAGRRANLAMSVWWKVGLEGSEARVEYIEGEWALPASSPSHRTVSSNRNEDDSRVNGLPVGLSVDKRPLSEGQPTAGDLDHAAGCKAHGDLLYGLSGLDLSSDPEAHHLLGGTLVVTLPPRRTGQSSAEQEQPSPPAPLEAPLRKILRIALYMHASALLEVALLDAHGRPPAPPPPRPSLFRAFSDKAASVRSARPSEAEPEPGGRRSSPDGGHRSSRWGRRRAKLSRTWGGLLGALAGAGSGSSSRSSAPSWADSSQPSSTAGEWEGLRPDQRQRLFSGDSTFVIEGPASSGSRQHDSRLEVSPAHSAPKAADSSPSETHIAMDRFSRSVAAMHESVFSTSPGVVFPPPPLLVRLRDAEARAARAPAASTSSYLTRQDASSVAHAFGASIDGDVRRFGERAPEGFRLTAEARAGIGCLMTGNGGLEAFGRHQSLSVLYQVLPASHPSILRSSASSFHDRTPARTPPRSPAASAHKLDPLSALPSTASHLTAALSTASAPASPAAGLDGGAAPLPRWLTLPFQPGTSSGSLGRILRRLARETDQGFVEDHLGERKEGTDWARTWLHAGVKVEAVAVSDGPIAPEQEVADGSHEAGIQCWVEHAESRALGEVQSLSEAAESVSFAKFLELLIYSDELFPASIEVRPVDAYAFSPVTTGTPTPLLRHYRVGSVIITFSVSTFDVYDVRLGKLTVGPAKAPRVSQSDDIASRCEESLAVSELRLQATAYFGALGKRLSLLKTRHLPGSPSKTPSKVLPKRPAEDGQEPPAKAPTAVSTAYAALHRLSKLVHEEETRVLDTLQTTPASQLNDVRRVLAEAIASTKAELAEWETAFGDDDSPSPAVAAIPEPAFVSDGKVHLLPGAPIVFHEDEPASFIALALSHHDYLKELTKVKPSGLASGLSTPRAEQSGFSLSATVTPTGSQLRPGSGLPDENVTVTRVDHPKDFSNAIFSLRGLPSLPKKRSDASLSLPSPGILPGHAGSLFKTAAASSEPTVTLGSAEGTMTAGDSLGKLVQEIAKTGVTEPTFPASQDDAASLPHANPGLRTPEPQVRPLSALSLLADLPDSGRCTPLPSTGRSTPRLPGHEDEGALGLGLPSTARSARRTPSVNPPTAAPSSIFGAWGSSKDESWTSSITSSLSALVGLGSGSIGRGGKDPVVRASSIHNLLSPDQAAPAVPIEDKPHVLVTSHFGKKELACTVYFASAFHLLRQRLGVERAFAHSLAHTRPWEARGGKSSALFWRTADDRYVVKELVAKWNCSDLQALLEISPAFFDFILGAAAVKPTSFAKILGFYSFKLTDHATGHTRRVELVVLENLFFDQTVSRTFDLKGIEGRRVRAGQGDVIATPAETVGHDHEWREGQQVAPLLIHAHAKRILREAVANDTRFLSSHNVIDFSMLVGVDEDKRELVLGLVDAIGAYTVFKALESKGKLLANKGGEVTVIPPEQYSARFEAAMEAYFTAVPDHWTSNPSRLARPAKPTIPDIF